MLRLATDREKGTLVGTLLKSFFDGFGPAGMFMRFEWPGAPTRIFAPTPALGAQQNEIVRDLLKAVDSGRIVSAKRNDHAGQVELTLVYKAEDLQEAGSAYRA